MIDKPEPEYDFDEEDFEDAESSDFMEVLGAEEAPGKDG